MKCLFAAFLMLLSLPAFAAKTYNVEIKNYMFSPPSLTIHAGDSVTFTNRDEVPHTIVDKDKAFRSAALDTGETYAHAFTAAGTYTYFCTLHPQMVGTITVAP